MINELTCFHCSSSFIDTPFTLLPRLLLASSAVIGGCTEASGETNQSSNFATCSAESESAVEGAEGRGADGGSELLEQASTIRLIASRLAPLPCCLHRESVLTRSPSSLQRAVLVPMSNIRAA